MVFKGGIYEKFILWILIKLYFYQPDVHILYTKEQMIKIIWKMRLHQKIQLTAANLMTRIIWLHQIINITIRGYFQTRRY